MGIEPTQTDLELPGTSLFDVARGHVPQRYVFSEYHAMGAVTGAFMIRKGQFKYVHYVGLPPQLFDLAADPLEARDLALEAGYAGLVADCEKALRTICNPEAVTRLAMDDQRARVESLGGKEAVLARGTFGYSPAPGTEAIFS